MWSGFCGPVSPQVTYCTIASTKNNYFVIDRQLAAANTYLSKCAEDNPPFVSKSQIERAGKVITSSEQVTSIARPGDNDLFILLQDTTRK